MDYYCKICGNLENNREFTVKEMLFGYRKEFLYIQCPICKCLQITEPPLDLADYYPLSYYLGRCNHIYTKKCSIKQFLKSERDEAVLLNGSAIGKILKIVFPMDKDCFLTHNAEIDFELMKKRNMSFDSKVIDIGCGQGFFLDKLSTIGFKNLVGIDPFVEYKISSNKFAIEKKIIYDVDEQFDLIVFNHAFEHMSDPFKVLKAVSRILSERGVCLIKIPIVSSHAWEKYRVNWVQLDAPRHLFLHSIESINLLLEKAGLKLLKIIYDSTDFQFWGSEQYLRDIPLRSSNSYLINPKNSIFSAIQIDEYKKKALDLNNKKLGDQAAFYLEKI